MTVHQLQSTVCVLILRAILLERVIVMGITSPPLIMISNIDIFNVYTHEPTRMMNFDRTVNNIAFYRQGKK